MIALFLDQTEGAQLLDDFAEEGRCRRQIVEVLPARPVCLVDLFDQILEADICLWILKIAARVIDALLKPVPQLGLDRSCRKGLDIFTQVGAELRRIEIVESATDNRKVGGEEVATGEVIERRDQLSSRRISGRSEDDHDQRSAGTPATVIISGIGRISIGRWTNRSLAVRHFDLLTGRIVFPSPRFCSGGGRVCPQN